MSSMLEVSPDWLVVSRETRHRLTVLAELVEKWSRAINLVGKAELAGLWRRHVLDCAQLWYLAPERPKTWLDLGSGGGFPGLVIAIMAAEAAPDCRVTLVESDLRKATFLREAARTLELPTEVIAERIDQAAPQRAQVLSARALAPLSELLGFYSRHVGPSGCGLFPKGANAEVEIAVARKSWTFHLVSTPSRTDPSGTILRVEGVYRA